MPYRQVLGMPSMAPPRGRRPDALPRHSFGSYRTRVDALVDLVPSAWSGMARITVPVITDELRQSPTMAPPLGASSPVARCPDHISSSDLARIAKIRNTGWNKWSVHHGLVDVVHGASARRPPNVWCTAPITCCHTSARLAAAVKHTVSRAHFVVKPLVSSELTRSSIQFKMISFKPCFYSFRLLYFPEIVRTVQQLCNFIFQLF